MNNHHASIFRRSALRLSAGFTLIELLVTLGMVAVLASLAAPSFNELRFNQKLASHSSDLFSSLLQARNESMRLNRQVAVAPLVAADWTSGWQVFVDMNANSSFDSGTDTLIVTSPPITNEFTATGAGGGAAPAVFVFDARGFLVNFNNGRIVFKSPQTNREKQVIVSSTGRARLCDPKLSSTCSTGY